jgi:hypothetical protein
VLEERGGEPESSLHDRNQFGKCNEVTNIQFPNNSEINPHKRDEGDLCAQEIDEQRSTKENGHKENTEPLILSHFMQNLAEKFFVDIVLDKLDIFNCVGKHIQPLVSVLEEIELRLQLQFVQHADNKDKHPRHGQV